MTACRLVQHVDMTNPDDGLSYAFAPGDVLPEWADGLLTPSARGYLCAGGAPAATQEPAQDVSETDDNVVEVVVTEQPKRPSGKASRADWAEYAESLGINVPSDAKRNDIIALVDAQEA